MRFLVFLLSSITTYAYYANYISFTLYGYGFSPCIVFVYRHLLKKNSFFHKLYFGKRCCNGTPHLDISAFSFLLILITQLVIYLLLFVSVFVDNSDRVDSPIVIAMDILLFLNLMIGTVAITYGISESRKSEKDFEKMTQSELDVIREEIIAEYPDYFEQEKNKKKSKKK